MTLTLDLSMLLSTQYLWKWTILGCSSWIKLSKSLRCFVSWSSNSLFVGKQISFQTTSTPSSESIARKALSIPGTFLCCTYNWREKKIFNVFISIFFHCFFDKKNKTYSCENPHLIVLSETCSKNFFFQRKNLFNFFSAYNLLDTSFFWSKYIFQFRNMWLIETFQAPRFFQCLFFKLDNSPRFWI